MQDMQTAAAVLEALRPRIETAVTRHTPEGVRYGADAIIAAHRVRWSRELAHDPSGNNLRSDAAREFLRKLGWETHGDPHEDHIRALLVASYGVEYAMLVDGTSSWSGDVAMLLEPFRQS